MVDLSPDTGIVATYPPNEVSRASGRYSGDGAPPSCAVWCLAVVRNRGDGAPPSCAVWCFSPMRWRGRHRHGRVEPPLDRKQRRGTGRAGFARAAGVGLPERSEPAGPQGAERVPPEHGVAAGGSRLSRPMAHAGTHDQREGRAPARPETAWATRVRSCASSSSVGVFLK